MSFNFHVMSYQCIKDAYTYDEVSGRLVRTEPYNNSKPARPSKQNGYINTRFNNVSYMEHRMVYLFHNPNMDQTLCVDHINGVTWDNRIENLRLVTHQENLLNNPKAKGYTIDSRRYSPRYRSKITINCMVYELGTYDNAIDARAAYLRAKKKYHVIEER